ncbi:MAG: carboxypeptidase-like regulatory domain-containing protein [Pyrinomonadaceae bacterium]
MKLGIAFLFVCGVVSVLFLGIRSQGAQTTTFQITGIVLDDKGSPLANARVSALHMTRPLKGRLPSSFTDNDGRFKISDLEAARYSVVVENETEGYANFLSIAYQSILTLAEPTEETPSAYVAIQMSPQAGRITGLVTDKNGAKVKEANVKICLIADPERCSYGLGDDNGRFQILAPPETVVVVTVSKDERKDFRLKQKINGVEKDSLILKSGENHHVRITLD